MRKGCCPESPSYESLSGSVESADVSTNPDRAVFYTHTSDVGGAEVPNWQVADFAAGASNDSDVGWKDDHRTDDSYTTINQTADGSDAFQQIGDAHDAGHIDANQKEELENKLSERFADGAEGSVTVYSPENADSETQNKVFYQTEFPTLLENEKVTEINGVAREELKEMYEKDPDVAFAALSNRTREHEEYRSERDERSDEFTREYGKPPKES